MLPPLGLRTADMIARMFSPPSTLPFQTRLYYFSLKKRIDVQ